MFWNLRVSAVLISLFVGYVIPITFFFALGALGAAASDSDHFSNVWVSAAITISFVLCPATAGYIAARLAKVVPLLHGLVVSVLGASLFSAMSQPFSPAASLFWVLAFSSAGVSGAWLWRRSAARSDASTL